MLVLGIDVGGTATRALVTTLEGTRVGFGRAGAANPVTVPISDAVAAVKAAVAEALSDVDPALIGSAVIGMAGSGKLGDPRLATAFNDIGVPVTPQVVGDVNVAFAAGTPARVGTVLISGTGAIAARIVDGALDASADGIGWLLGDLGSGFWLGRSAAAITARELYSRRLDGLLTRMVATAVLGSLPTGPPSRQLADDLIGVIHDAPPLHLARLAPLVSEAAMAGDPQALSIVDSAAGHLVDSVAEVYQGGPIVLAGSVLREPGPVREAVQRLLAQRWPEATITLAEPGEVGAARLAARALA